MLAFIKKRLLKKLETMSPDEIYREAKQLDRLNEEEKAFLYYKYAANVLKHDHAPSQYRLSDYYYYGMGGCEVNEEKALYWLERAAEKGHIRAQEECAYMYREGKGCTQNLQKALYWYEQCLKSLEENPDNTSGLQPTNISNIISKVRADIKYGPAPEPKPVSPAVKQEPPKKESRTTGSASNDQSHKPAPADRTPSAADAKLAEEVNNMGLFCHNAKDYKKALELFEEAAKLGHKGAQFNCGLMYQKGQGCITDNTKALYWYEKAAEQGHKESQFQCGMIYLDNMNLQKSRYWFEKAAAQGHEVAINMMRISSSIRKRT